MWFCCSEAVKSGAFDDHKNLGNDILHCMSKSDEACCRAMSFSSGASMFGAVLWWN